MHHSFLQLGLLHIPVLGVFAAAGVIGALLLSQRTAGYAGVDPDTTWNAGVAALVCAFLVSRLLLVAFNWKSFLRYPLTLLSVPSWSVSGLVLSGLPMLVYLRWRRLPLLPLLDVMTSPFTLLWACTSLGRIVEGTHDGMPLPAAPSTQLVRAVDTYPVETYTFVAALVVCALTFLRLRSRPKTGSTTGLGCALAGLSIYFIGFLRLPSDLVAGSWLDPEEVIAVLMIVTGAGVLYRAKMKAKFQEEIGTGHAV